MSFNRVLAVGVPCGLTIVKGDLLPPLDLPLGEQAEAGHVGIQAVDIHIEDVQVGITAVVDEVAKVAIEGCVHRV